MKTINVNQINVGYSDVLILKELCLNIPIGKTTAIIGPNGCGKSTLLKSMGRILDLKKGAIFLDGKEIHRMPTKELASKLAILPQSPIAPQGLTVEELVSFGRYPYQKGFGKLTEEDKNIVTWAIEATNLSEIRYKAVDSLSGGQRQRVWIAMALAQETDVILLDEPTTYLDMAYQLEVLELLDELNKEYGCTIVMVLHDLNLAAKFADYMVALGNVSGIGTLIKAGSPEVVMTPEVLRMVYKIEANIAKDPISHRPLCLSYELMEKEKNVKRMKKKVV